MIQFEQDIQINMKILTNSKQTTFNEFPELSVGGRYSIMLHNNTAETKRFLLACIILIVPGEM